jgi:H3 lysine-79-specific histone-lysine N-methyltransferase
VDERGEWGRGWVGFVRCEEVVRGQVSGWAGGGGEAKGRLEKYQACKHATTDEDVVLIPIDFPQAGFENAEPLPSVELLYPASGCREKWVMDRDGRAGADRTGSSSSRRPRPESIPPSLNSVRR